MSEDDSALTASAGRVPDALEDESMGTTAGVPLLEAAIGLFAPELAERKRAIEAKLDEKLGTIRDEFEEHEVGKKAAIAGAAGTAVVGGGLVLGAVGTGAAATALAPLVVAGAAAYGAYKTVETAVETVAPALRVAATTGAASVSLSYDGYKWAAKKVYAGLWQKWRRLRRLPFFTSEPVLTASQDAPYTYAVAADDPGLAHGDTWTVTAPTLPGWLTLTDNGVGTAMLSGMPTGDDGGRHQVVLRVTDGSGRYAEQTFTIEVTTRVENMC